MWSGDMDTRLVKCRKVYSITRDVYPVQIVICHWVQITKIGIKIGFVRWLKIFSKKIGLSLTIFYLHAVGGCKCCNAITKFELFLQKLYSVFVLLCFTSRRSVEMLWRAKALSSLVVSTTVLTTRLATASIVAIILAVNFELKEVYSPRTLYI